MKIAILLVGHMRSWKLCRQSFLNTFGCVDHEIDIFVHTYDCKLNFHPYIENTYNVKDNLRKITEIDIINEIGFHLKKIVIEKQEDVDEEIRKLNLPINFDTYSQHRKTKLCNELKNQYETENNFKYDMVVKTRFDIMFSCTLGDIVRYISHNDADMKKIYVSKGPSIQPCDQVIISSSRKMTWISEKLTIPLSMEEHNEEKYNPHEWFDMCCSDDISKIPFLYTIRFIAF